MKKTLATMLTLAVVLLAGVAMADSIAWRQGGGDGYADVTADDNYVYGFLPTTNYGTADYLQLRGSRTGLLGWAELFTLVPGTSGGNAIVIDSATLTIFDGTGATSVDPVTICRMTTPWLLGAAGTNETNTDYQNRDIGNLTTWASGDFSAADYTMTNSAEYYYQGWAAEHQVDITAIMQDIYTSGVNAGIAYVYSNAADGANVTSTNNTSYPANRPALNMTYHYATPEPATMGLLGLGGLAMLRRRKK